MSFFGLMCFPTARLAFCRAWGASRARKAAIVRTAHGEVSSCRVCPESVQRSSALTGKSFMKAEGRKNMPKSIVFHHKIFQIES